MDFEPNLGVAMRSRIRYQLNMRLDKGMVENPLLARAQHSYLPLWWIEMGGDGPDPAAAQFLQSGLADTVQVCFAGRVLVSLVAVPLVGYGLGIARASIKFLQKH